MRAAAAWLGLAVMLGGCMSVPHASSARDAEAREYRVHPGWSTLYVYRPDPPSANPNLDDVVLFVDERLIGDTLPGSFFRIDVRPGEHVLHGFGYDQGRMKLATEPDTLYFVRLNSFGGTSQYTPVAPEAGKREIAKCCVLLENWQPGQRPLLR